MSEQTPENKPNEITLNEKNFDIFVAKFIPTSQYFERSFEMLQVQINGLRDGQKELKDDIDRRFEQVDRGQKDLKDDINKRFEHVDKRFEHVDKRFDQINTKLDTIIERMDVKIDAGLRENRAMSIRLFSFAMVFQPSQWLVS